MHIRVTKLLPAVMLLITCVGRAQQPITLTAVKPKILGVTNLNDGVTLTAQATGPGSFSFTITSFAGTQGSGTITINAPATLLAHDNGTSISFPGFAQFSGQDTFTTNDSFIDAYWDSKSSGDMCFSNDFSLHTGAFSCQIQTLLFVENVGGQRLAYFDGFIFYQDEYVDFGYEIDVRMYYQIPNTTQSVMEAVQVTQSLASDSPSYAPTPFIAGKTTTIRLYPVQSGPLGPVGAKINVVSDHLLGTLQAPYNLTPQASVNRDFTQPRASFDFEIPAAWTTKGDLTIGGQFLDQGFGKPPDPDPLTLHFQNQAKPFSIKFMEWCAPISNPPPGIASATPVCTSSVPGHAEDMADAAWYMRATYPTADNGITYAPLLMPPQTWKGEMKSSDGMKAFVNHLRRWYVTLRGFAGFQDDQLIAWFPYDPTWGAGGEADPISYNLYPATTPLSAVGHVAWVADNGVFHIMIQAWAEESLAHEIGHNLGLRHTATADWGGGTRDSKSCYPYTSSHIQNPGYYSVPESAMLIPTSAWDFMSYHSYQPTWVSPYTYDILVRGGLQPQDNSINRNWDATQKKCVAPATPTSPHAITENASPQPTERTLQPEATAASTDSIIISGTVSQNGSATLVPSYRVPSGIVTDQSDPAGTYCINFNNGATNLSSFCFTPSFDDPEGGANSLTIDWFSFVLPFPTLTSSITMTKQGIQIVSIAVSKNAPVVNITTPKAGDTWNGGTQTIAWTASDADGDPLMYSVLYSTDGGSTYMPLALDLTTTQYSIDPSTIMGGSVFFRVLASDGINNTTASAGPITVNQTPKLAASAASFAIGNATTSAGAKGIVTLVSSGSGPVTITSASIDNSAFVIVDPPMPLVIAAGHRASLTVTFLAPSGAQGAQTATITVASNDPLSPLKIPITGNASANAVPNAAITPKSLSFSAPANQTQILNIGIANSGAANLTVNSVSISNASFALVGVQTPLTIAPNTSQLLPVRFTAPASGSPSGTATISTNDPTNPSTAVALSGSVYSLAPVLTVTKTHSGNFQVSQQSAVYTVTVTNTGNAPTSGTVTVTENLPSGLTLVSMAGTNWNCSNNTCTRSDVLNPTASYPAITVTVNVASSTPTQLTNVVNVSGGGAASTGAADVTAIPQALGFFPIAPCRMVDTRASQNKTGAFGPPALGAFAGRDFPLLGSTCTINPAAKGYSLNFTVVPPGNLDFLSAWPSGQPYPGVSTLNSPDGSVIANAALLPAGNSGNVTVVTGEATDLIIDANGYFAPPNGQDLAFYTVTPCRIVDTRSGQGKSGAFGPPSLGAYAGRDFPIANSCGVPASAKAFSLNMTVVPTSHLDFLSTWPAGQGYPGVSTLNSSDGSIIANAAIVPSGNSGSITVLAGNPTDLIIDVNGYFAPPGSPGALHFYPLPPCRIADTRAGQGKTGAFGPPSLAAYTGRNFPLQSSACNIPATAQAYSLNLTAIPQGHLDFLSMWPTGQPYPGVSTLNSPKGTIVANAAIVPAGSGGSVTILAGNPTDLIIDINGYFAP